jgi:hypothetical protein
MKSGHLKRFSVAPDIVVIAVLTGLWALFFWQLLTPTAADRVIFRKGDFPLHYFSYSDYQAERLWDGEIPLWNPYNYGGDPFAANVQWVVWYPPRWIAIALAGPHGWGIEALQLEVAAHYWLASLMMYAFLRVLVKRPFPAVAGSVLWTYGGYLAGYPMLQPSILEAVIWLPLLMLGAHLSVTHPRWRVHGIVLGGVMIGLSFLGGHTQTTMQMTYFAAAYMIFLGWQRQIGWRGIAWRIALLGGLGIALCAVQLLPAVEFTRLSYRVETYRYADKSTGFTVTEWAQFLWPRLFNAEYWPLYVGVAGLLLALGAILRAARQFAFWIGAIVVGLWLSLGGYSIVYDFFYVLVPGFNTFREQERAASIAVFALVVLATHQMAWLLNRREQPPGRDESRQVWLARGHLILTALVFLVMVLVLIVRGDDGTQDPISHAMGLVLFVSLLFNAWLVWRQRERHALIPAALLLLIVVDLFSFGVNSPNFVEDNAHNRIQPPDFMDVLSVPVKGIQWHVDGAAGIQTYGTYWRIPDIYGTGPFKLSSTEKLRQMRVDRRWEVFAVRYATMIADVPENVPAVALGEGVNTDGQPYTLYELSDPRPFASLVYQVRVSEDGQDGARAIMAEPWINLREIGVTTKPLPFELPSERPALSQVDAFKMAMPEYMEMSVSTSENALLTLPVADYPGWRATVNGSRVEIVDTYAGLIGIPIRAGENQKVTLRFVPTSVIVGGVISAAAWLAVAGYVIAVVFRARRKGARIRYNSGLTSRIR